MTFLVTGVRGQVGRGVVNRLHAAGHSVRAASSNPVEAAAVLPAGVRPVPFDLTRPEAHAEALQDVTALFLYSSETGIDELIRAAEEAGVQHVVLLSSSSVLLPDAEQDGMAGPHVRVERALAQSKLTTTVLRPGAFSSNSLSWSFAIRGGMPMQLPYPDAHLTVVHPEDLAEIATAALTTEALTGRTLTLSGPESLTFRRQIDCIGALLDRTIPVLQLTRAEAEQTLGRHMPAPILASLLKQWAAADGVPAPIADTTETLLGTPARTFAQWAEENLQAFAG